MKRPSQPIGEPEREAVRFNYEGGLSSFVSYLNEGKDPLFPKPIYMHATKVGHDGPVEFEVAMQWNGSYAETIYTYVNNIATRQGGTHLTGFSTALTRALNTYIKNNHFVKADKLSITGEDMREGLTATAWKKNTPPENLTSTRYFFRKTPTCRNLKNS